MKSSLYKKIVGVSTVGFVLYSTGVLSVLGGFWRTLTPGLFDTPTQSESNIYGYGYGDGSWGYGYGYGYGYAFGYGYGYGLTSADPYYNAGILINSLSGGVSMGAGSSVSTGSTTFSGSSTTITSILSTLLGSSVSSVYETVLSSNAESILETPVSISGKTVTLSLPTGLKIYSNTGNSFSILNTGASVSASSISSSISSVVAALELGDPNVVLVFDQPVTVVIAGVGTTVDRLSFKLSGQSTWTTSTLSSSSCTPTVGGECAYLSGSDLVIKTYHFTQFAAAVATSSSSSSSSSGGGGGGGGGTSSTTSTATTGTVTTISLVTTGEIQAFEDKVQTLLNNSGFVETTVKVNGTSVSLSTPKFNSESVQTVVNKINAKVLAEIGKRKIRGTDLASAIDSYNNLLAAIKLLKDNNDPQAKKMAQYYLQEFNKIITSYPVIKSSDKLKDEEFEYALSFMKRNSLTKYSGVDEFRPNDGLTRQEAAKFFVEFATKVLNKSSSTSGCVFTDLAGADITLKDYIAKSCELGLMKGKDGKFMPFEKVTKAQALTVLIRAIVGTSLDETVSPWYKNYFEKSKTLGLTKETVITNLDKPLSRYEAGLLMYRSSDKKSEVTLNK